MKRNCGHCKHHVQLDKDVCNLDNCVIPEVLVIADNIICPHFVLDESIIDREPKRRSADRQMAFNLDDFR